MILAENVYLEKGFKSNQNVLVLGVPGSGKSRGHILPNLMEMDSSFLILDPKGELYDISEEMLQKRGYRVDCIDFDEPLKTKSYYNPLMHIHSEEDIIKLSSLLVGGQKKYCKDPFWPDSSAILANALIGYLYTECREEDRNLGNFLNLLKQMDALAASNGRESTLDIMFEAVKKHAPNSFALEQYELLSKCAASEKTLSSIIISLIATFSSTMTKGIKYLTNKDTVNFKKMGHIKTALFVKSSDTDRSKDVLVSMLFQQAMDELCKEADSLPNHCLPVHVHLFLDDFGTNLTIERFDALIAGMRSREISCSVVIQSEGQLRAMYGPSWSTLLGSCRSYVFLGSNDLETCKAISVRMNVPLDDILYKSQDDILVFTQGCKPQKAKRYDLKQHLLYPQLKDFVTTNMHYATER